VFGVQQGAECAPEVVLSAVLFPRDSQNGRNYHQRQGQLSVSRRVNREVPNTG
jgi:hypothetical protein